MKKLIWVFGYPGSGRKTIIDNIINESSDIKKILNIKNTKVSYVKLPFDREMVSSDYGIIQLRKEAIYKCITNFINNNDNIIVINGEYIDYDTNNSILKKVSIDFPNLEKEILILNPSNIDIFYERLKNTDFFHSNFERNIVKYPKEWLDLAVKYMSETLHDYENIGYKVYEIDTLDGYSINDKTKPNVK